MSFKSGLAVAASAILLGGCTTGGDAKLPSDPYAPWAAGRSVPAVDSLYPTRGTDAIDVLHYGLDLTWSPTASVLTGTATLQIRPVRDAPSISLDFKPYQIDSLALDGKAVEGEVSHEKLVVRSPVRAGVPVTLIARYHGRPAQTPMPSKRPDAHPLGLTIDDHGGLWTMQEPFGAFTWYPSNDHPSDEALYDIAVTVPPGWSAIASGTPAGQQGQTFRYRSAVPVATYVTTLAVGKYHKATATGPRGIPVTYWYRADETRILPMVKKSAKFLEWIEQRFGPYPFDSAGVVLVDSDSAMETQQMVTMGASIADRGSPAFELDLLHEFAHQWFGDSVTLTDWRDMWLNEGWALYVQKLYQMDAYGLSQAELVRTSRQRDAELRRQYGPPSKPDAAEFGATNVYTCAAAMLRQLHQALGDKRFFALARGWVHDNRNTQQNRQTFTTYVNRTTGHDFTAPIDTWLDSPVTPPEVKPLAS